MYSKLVLASAVFGLAAALPHESRSTGVVVTGSVAVSSVNDSDGGAAVDKYTYFKGDGSTADGWPAKSAWASFDNLWNANKPLMQSSCGDNGWGADDSSTEIADIRSAIEAQAAASKVDHRFILAVVMQESNGCVRVPTTNNGENNPGLMQSAEGSGTCVGKNPCPQSEITQMITDGTSGTPSGDGLSANINQAQSHLGDGDLAQIFYAAARIYNSGAIDWSNLDNPEGATACYSSDVANRLLGWTNAASSCPGN